MAGIQQSYAANGIAYKTARIEFAYADKSYQFNINPQAIEVITPHRTTPLKTQGRYVVEDFNDDIQTVKISGTTGGPRLNGAQAAMNLWNFLDTYSNDIPSYGQTPNDYLIFYNHTDGYAWSTVIGQGGYSFNRSVDHPLMWNYEINLVVIGYAGETIDESLISGGEVSTTDINKQRTPTVDQIKKQQGTTKKSAPKPKKKSSSSSKAKQRKNGYGKNTSIHKNSKTGSKTLMQAIGGK